MQPLLEYELKNTHSGFTLMGPFLERPYQPGLVDVHLFQKPKGPHVLDIEE
jgi:hypothetical protein